MMTYEESVSEAVEWLTSTGYIDSAFSRGHVADLLRLLLAQQRDDEILIRDLTQSLDHEISFMKSRFHDLPPESAKRRYLHRKWTQASGAIISANQRLKAEGANNDH